MFFPLRHWGFQQVRNGEIPLWNPMILCGMPNVAEIQSAIFYPPNLLFAVLPTATAYNLCLGLHLFLAAAFTYALLVYYGASRSGGAIAGLTYMLCGPQVTHLWAGHITMVCVMAWSPLLVLCFDHAVRTLRWASGLRGAMVLAWQLLAGHPQCVLYSIHTVLLLGLALAVWKFCQDRKWSHLAGRIAVLGVCLGLGFGLAAIQLAPGWEFVPYSARGALGFEWSGTHSFPPENLLSLLIPEFFFHWGRGYLWETCAYVGIVPLFLAFAATAAPRRKMVWLFAGLAVASFLLAMSRYTPFYHLAYFCVPGFSVFRGHAKYLVTTALALSVLAGLGIDTLVRLEEQRIRRRARVCLWFCVGMAVAGAALFLSSSRGLNPPDLWWHWLEATGAAADRMTPQTVSLTWNMMLGSGLRTAMLLGITAVWLSLMVPGRRFRGAASVAGIAIVLLDLSLFAWKYFEVTPAGETAEPSARGGVPHALVAARMPGGSPGNENQAMLRNVPSAEGYVGNVPAWYREFFHAAQSEDLRQVVFTFRRKGHGPLSLLFGEADQYRGEVGPPVAAEERPLRAFYLPQPADTPLSASFRPPVSDPDADGLPPRRSVWPYPVSETAQHLRHAEIASYRSNYIELRMQTGRTDDSHAVLTDTFYPGWKAFVDGEARNITPAYHTFRSVLVDPGAQRLEFIYDPFTFRLGLAASLFPLAGWVATFALFAARRTKMRTPQTSAN
jgi:hypothetical protein